MAGGNTLANLLVVSSTSNVLLLTSPKVIIKAWDAYLVPAAGAAFPINVAINIEDFAQNSYYSLQLYMTALNQIAQSHVYDLSGMIPNPGLRVNFNFVSGGGLQNFVFLNLFYESQ